MSSLLSEELSLVYEELNRLDGDVDQSQMQAVDDAPDAAREGGGAVERGKPAQDDSQLSAEQLAKVEAKRKAKAEKDAGEHVQLCWCSSVVMGERKVDRLACVSSFVLIVTCKIFVCSFQPKQQPRR